MADITLLAQTPLRGYSKRFGHTHLYEVQHVSIYSVALSLHAESAVSSIEKTLEAQWPKTGHSSTSRDGTYQLLGLQSDQIFVLIHSPDLDTVQAALMPQLHDTAYVTDQSDGWVGLRIAGKGAIPALERVCLIDLHTSTFAVGQVTRTMMEHLAVIIMRDADDSYVLFSPTSSAQSFVQMLEVSLHNTLG